MIFTTQCPSCESNFPIDSAKVPVGGVYASCSKCEGVFLVEVPEAPPAATPKAAKPEAATATPAQVAQPVPVPKAAVPKAATPKAAVPKAATPKAATPEQAAPAPASTPTAPPVFGKRDPNERAQRLARVLVSDMIAYHPDRHKSSLDAGTLATEFDEEIQKSWNEYVDQVGSELAEGTSYFKDALNQILARGDSVFT